MGDVVTGSNPYGKTLTTTLDLEHIAYIAEHFAPDESLNSLHVDSVTRDGLTIYSREEGA